VHVVLRPLAVVHIPIAPCILSRSVKFIVKHVSLVFRVVWPGK
jgi:hypothetical protein